MISISRIHVGFCKPMAELHVPVRYKLATMSQRPDVEPVDSITERSSSTKNDRSDQRTVEAERFIARVREVLQKEGIQ
jgi:hypothetical protein